MFLTSSLIKVYYCGEPTWRRGSVLGLEPPGIRFRILCLKVLLAQFNLYVHTSGLKSHSFIPIPHRSLLYFNNVGWRIRLSFSLELALNMITCTYKGYMNRIKIRTGHWSHWWRQMDLFLFRHRHVIWSRRRKCQFRQRPQRYIFYERILFSLA